MWITISNGGHHVGPIEKKHASTKSQEEGWRNEESQKKLLKLLGAWQMGKKPVKFLGTGHVGEEPLKFFWSFVE